MIYIRNMYTWFMCRIEKKSGLEMNRTAGMWCTSACCCDLCCSPPLLLPLPSDMAWDWPWALSPHPERPSSKSSRLDVMVRRMLWYLQIPQTNVHPRTPDKVAEPAKQTAKAVHQVYGEVFYWYQRFTAMFMKVCHWFLPIWIQSTFFSLFIIL
jgi:hypothetical protein